MGWTRCRYSARRVKGGGEVVGWVVDGGWREYGLTGRRVMEGCSMEEKEGKGEVEVW